MENKGIQFFYVPISPFEERELVSLHVKSTGRIGKNKLLRNIKN